jgi:hypothetical protein
VSIFEYLVTCRADNDRRPHCVTKYTSKDDSWRIRARGRRHQGSLHYNSDDGDDKDQ